MQKKPILLKLSLVIMAVLLWFTLSLTHGETVEPSISITSLASNKAVYKPGEPVQFSAKTDGSNNEDYTLNITYYHKGEVIDEESISATGEFVDWSWSPLNTDHTGYLAKVQQTKNMKTIAIDVSSDWTTFPRYGFLSKFNQQSSEEQADNIETLNRYHINAIQFYDWHDEHHYPLKSSGNEPLESWANIANQPVYFDTVDHYIDLAHQSGMQAMSYNLLNGSLSGAEDDGVREDWYLNKQNQVDTHNLPDPWKSDIFLTDPGNEEWQQYLLNRQQQVFDALPFDGWHIDQLGDRGDVYDSQKNSIDLEKAYGQFLQSTQRQFPNKTLIMNAVNQFGQQQIAENDLPFLYTEVWEPNDTYADLNRIILENKQKYGKNTVIAGYMNYDSSNTQGEFNTASVLYTDAFLFAHGAAHLELGEHMLSKEYFPHNQLKMTEKLQDSLVNYYDFMVAYQNVLRGGLVSTNTSIRSSNEVSISDQPDKESIYTFSKKNDQQKVIHLLNYSNAKHMNWRDTDGVQKAPDRINSLPLTIEEDKKVKNVWVASPDWDGGVPHSLEFTQKNGEVKLNLPQLKYWDMIVLEY